MTNDKPARDFRQEVTDNIIRLLEEGTTPWQKPWKAGEAGRIPYNPTTGKAYRGGNVITLMIAGMHKGTTDPRWVTYRQAAEKEWQVRKGEKASHIEFWEPRRGAGGSTEATEATADGDTEAKPGRRTSMIHKVYAVFNATQIDGIPEMVLKAREPWEVCETGERILKESGADIRYGGDRAFYSRTTDHIQLPPRECFTDAQGFYGTSTHELVHWSGAEKRLNRATLIESRTFGDQSYSREELRAEIGSMMLAAETGIPHDPAQHAAYVASWIKSLKNDKNEIFRAAADASKAVDYVLARGQATTERRTLGSVPRANFAAV